MAEMHDSKLAIQSPSDFASDVIGELFDVLTLMISAAHERLRDDVDTDNMTGAESRADSLLLMAENRVRALIQRADHFGTFCGKTH